MQRAKLLTLLVEFNPSANDDFSGFERPNDSLNPTGCVTEPDGTLLNGPLHNEMPDPATIGRGTDNNTFWVPDFTPDFYQQMIYSTRGVTQRIRPDLNGGISIKGKTVRNYYTEVSKGRYLITGEVSPWLMLPHSEAWYSADTCEAGRASDIGHPDNELRHRTDGHRRGRAHWPPLTRTSRGPTTTSRIRATSTTTATCTNPTAHWTT